MRSHARTIFAWTKGRRRTYLGAVAALVFASCFLYLVPLMPQVALDGVLSSRPEEAAPITRAIVEAFGGQRFLAENLWVFALTIVLLTALAGWFTYLRKRWAAAARA